jgi:hypothetical protein
MFVAKCSRTATFKLYYNAVSSVSIDMKKVLKIAEFNELFKMLAIDDYTVSTVLVGA